MIYTGRLILRKMPMNLNSTFRFISFTNFTTAVFSIMLWSCAVSTPTDLESMTYLTTWLPGGKVTLSNGEYRQPVAPGSASEIIIKLTGNSVFGDINGNKIGAVILTTDSGGSGTFYDLALLLREGGKWVNTDSLLLGDRVRISKMEIKDAVISVTLITHGPQDPMCCPTARVTKRFNVNGTKLKQLNDADESPTKN